MMDDLPAWNIVTIPEGWEGPFHKQYIQRGERKIWLTEGEFCISDKGGWIPGIWPTIDAALAGFDEYYVLLTAE